MIGIKYCRSLDSGTNLSPGKVSHPNKTDRNICVVRFNGDEHLTFTTISVNSDAVVAADFVAR